MARVKLGEIECPNCQQRLSIWQNKKGTGFVSCGLCGYWATNMQTTKEVKEDANGEGNTEPERSLDAILSDYRDKE